MDFFHFLALIPFYALGVFPTGVLVAKLHGIDIASKGSGNTGATNVARTLGKKAGIITLVGDLLKGAIAVIIASFVFTNPQDAAIAGFLAVCGHCFSIPGKLKGGKGVATALGVLLALSPVSALIAAILFAIVFGISRIVSLSSITAALIAPLYIFFMFPEKMWSMPVAAMALLIVYRHKENIQRLTEGREPKFSFGTNAKA